MLCILPGNSRIICVMFWSFPYLLWQAFGHWSGFLVGVLVALALTVMFNNLFTERNGQIAFSARQHSAQAASQPQQQEMEQYQRGYQAEVEPYRAGPHSYMAGEPQPQYEEMQVPYPQEVMPPMEQRRVQRFILPSDKASKRR